MKSLLIAILKIAAFLLFVYLGLVFSHYVSDGRNREAYPGDKSYDQGFNGF